MSRKLWVNTKERKRRQHYYKLYSFLPAVLIAKLTKEKIRIIICCCGHAIYLTAAWLKQQF